MLAITLNGGLGNQLFQLAAAETIAAETGKQFCIVNAKSPSTVHAERNYFETILQQWKDIPVLPENATHVTEPSYEKQAWTLPDGAVCLNGYFQNWRYVPPSFAQRLTLSTQPPMDGAFLHIRGGDYVNHWLHDLKLNAYYERAVAYFPPGTHFFVFTNDVPYAKTFPILSTIPHTIVDADELTSLSQMAACTLGGICANSSFSWWGAYLNPNRTIVMPDKWFNDPNIYTEGYYFNGVTRCPTITMIAANFAGGLGNQLFQLAAAETIARETGKTLCILTSVSPPTHHSNRNYFDTLLSEWASCPLLPSPYTVVNEPSYEKQEWAPLLPNEPSIRIDGFFQNWEYVSSTFVQRLRLPYHPPIDSAFIHIRGGDYVGTSAFDVGLHRGYYARAVQQFPKGTHFYIFTNDVPYAKTLEFLNDVRYSFVTSDEVTALAQMAACSIGGICANSSFSWWGAYLNPNRTIVMPDKWFGTLKAYTEGFYFPGVIRVPV